MKEIKFHLKIISRLQSNKKFEVYTIELCFFTCAALKEKSSFTGGKICGRRENIT
jgi:hypothetical protein